MKHERRGVRIRKPIGLKPGRPADAFGLWLERSLGAQYTPILDEPIPQALLDLIEADRQSRAAPSEVAEPEE